MTAAALYSDQQDTFEPIYLDKSIPGDQEPLGVRESMFGLGVRFDDVALDIATLQDEGVYFEDYSETLTQFSADNAGSVESAFTKAILCRNEVNHLGYSTATPNAQRVHLPTGYDKAEIRANESRNGIKSGYKVIAIPHF